MNKSQAIRTSRALLRAAGAVVVRRKGGHEIWHLSSGHAYPIRLHAADIRQVRHVRTYLKRFQKKGRV